MGRWVGGVVQIPGYEKKKEAREGGTLGEKGKGCFPSWASRGEMDVWIPRGQGQGIRSNFSFGFS